MQATASRSNTPNLSSMGRKSNTQWCILLCFAILLLFIAYPLASFPFPSIPMRMAESASSHPENLPEPLPPLKSREHIGHLLESQGFRVGAEIGVQRGDFARTVLSNWTSCQAYYLIDVWAHQSSYQDLANVDTQEQEQIFQDAQNTLKVWKNKTSFLRMRSDQAVRHFRDLSLDFVYVDARHDYCGVTQDLQLFWPKLRRGGIMSGHDYRTAADVAPDQDWSLCESGTRNPGAVKGAVDDFAAARNLQLSVTYRDGPWNTWLLRKPLADTWK